MANFFEKLFPKKKSDAVVGIDIGGSFVKVVQLRKKGEAVALDTYGEIALGPLAGLEIGQATNLQIEKLAAAIKDIFIEAKVTATDMVFSLPLTSTLLMVIEMPNLGEEKLKEMVPLEARKYIPTSVDEVTISHWVIPRLVRSYVDPDAEDAKKNSAPTVDILLAAVHNDVLAKYSDIAGKVGATNVSFEIEVFSTIRSVLGRESGATMLLDIGGATTKAIIVEEGIVRSSHLINAGSQEATTALARVKKISMREAEELKRMYGLTGNPDDPAVAEIVRLSMERILVEANRILRNYQQEKRVSIGRVVLAGGGALMLGLQDLATVSFGTTIVYGNAFEKIETPPAIAPLLKDAGPEFAVALGLALRKLQ